jgi:hypothetical protein
MIKRLIIKLKDWYLGRKAIWLTVELEERRKYEK